jgi:hypothetical protein
MTCTFVMERSGEFWGREEVYFHKLAMIFHALLKRSVPRSVPPIIKH